MKTKQIMTHLKEFINFIFPIKIGVKVIIIFVILLFTVFKGCQIYFYFSHKIKAEQSIYAIESLNKLCSNNKNIEKNNSKYFHEQQKFAADTVSKFYVGDYNILGDLFFGKQFEDAEWIFYKKLLSGSYEHCPKLLELDPKNLHEDLKQIEDKMLHKIIWFV
ncbi:MAG: hypothetical protein V4591_01565 [Bdellovibrionota bacterium]